MIQAIADGTRLLDDDIRALAALREHVQQADQAAADVRVRVDGHDTVIRESRQMLEQIRAQAGELDVARATAQSDLTHLGQLCEETIQASLDQILSDVEQMEEVERQHLTPLRLRPRSPIRRPKTPKSPRATQT